MPYFIPVKSLGNKSSDIFMFGCSFVQTFSEVERPKFSTFKYIVKIPPSMRSRRLSTKLIAGGESGLLCSVTGRR